MRIEAEEIRKVHVNPGDVVVLRVGKTLEAEMHQLLQEKLTEYFPHNKAIVLSGDVSLEVYTGGAVL